MLTQHQVSKIKKGKVGLIEQKLTKKESTLNWFSNKTLSKQNKRLL